MSYYEFIRMIPELLYAQRLAFGGLAVTGGFAISMLIIYLTSEVRQ